MMLYLSTGCRNFGEDGRQKDRQRQEANRERDKRGTHRY